MTALFQKTEFLLLSLIAEFRGDPTVHIFILTLGTRGDVQPYVAFGRRLVASGHQVTICTSSSFEGFITDHGLKYG